MLEILVPIEARTFLNDVRIGCRLHVMNGKLYQVKWFKHKCGEKYHMQLVAKRIRTSKSDGERGCVLCLTAACSIIFCDRLRAFTVYLLAHQVSIRPCIVVFAVCFTCWWLASRFSFDSCMVCASCRCTTVLVFNCFFFMMVPGFAQNSKLHRVHVTPQLVDVHLFNQPLTTSCKVITLEYYLVPRTCLRHFCRSRAVLRTERAACVHVQWYP